MKLIIFDNLHPFDTAKVVNSQEIIRLHGSVDAKDILDGAHPRYTALYAGVFLAKLKNLHERLSAEAEE